VFLLISGTILKTVLCNLLVVVVASLTFAMPVAAETLTVNLVNLHAMLGANKSLSKLTHRDAHRFPKLESILASSNPDAFLTDEELTRKFKQYVESVAALFASVDMNADGKLSMMEVATRSPKLLVYFPYIDLNRDGRISLEELLSSPVFFNFTANSHGKNLKIGADVFGSLPADPHLSVKEATQSNELLIEQSDVVSENLDDFYAAELARLTAFFSTETSKDDPDVLELVVITGSTPSSTGAGTGGLMLGPKKPFAITKIELPDGTLCRAGCWAAGGAVCAAVAAFCSVGTVITLGTLAIPCTPVVITTCGLSAGASSICNDICSAN
jgi:hypothetical protein